MTDDDFYVGYLDRAPKPLGRFLGLLVVTLVVLGGGLAVAIALAHRSLEPSTFEFLNVKSFEGVMTAEPYPSLLVARPGMTDSASTTSAYLLVREGKYGAQDLADAFAGQRVRLDGTLIYRDDQTMIEVVEGTVSAVGAGDVMRPAAVDLGQHTLHGEIVDSKCFLGVMNPGELKSHRACASLCIRGGIPPVLVVREGEQTHYVLVQNAQGEAANEAVLDYVAEPVALSGTLYRHGDTFALHADTDAIQRVR